MKEPRWDVADIADRGRGLLVALVSVEQEAGRVLLILLAALAHLHKAAPPAARPNIRGSLRRVLEQMEGSGE